MFYILSKTVGLLTKPFCWILILLVMAVFCRNPRLKRKALVCTLILMLVFSNPLLFNFSLRHWEPRPVATEQLATYDIGIVLGGFSRHLPEYNAIALTEAGDRLWQTVNLYKQGKIRKILVSGGSIGSRKPEAETVRAALLAIGIPDSDILVDPTSKNTHENAKNSADIIAGIQPGATCLLITSAIHMPRSLACFRKAGLNPDAFPVEHLTRYDKFMWAELWVPQVEVLRNWNRLSNEWIGMIVYKVQKYI